MSIERHTREVVTMDPSKRTDIAPHERIFVDRPVCPFDGTDLVALSDPASTALCPYTWWHCDMCGNEWTLRGRQIGVK